MTDRKKVLPGGDLPAGFRVGPDGVIELMTQAEVDAAIVRVINEALKQLQAAGGQIGRRGRLH